MLTALSGHQVHRAEAQEDDILSGACQLLREGKFSQTVDCRKVAGQRQLCAFPEAQQVVESVPA